MECANCNSKYNFEENTPIKLSCYHMLCNACVTKTINDFITCPQCLRKTEKGHSSTVSETILQKILSNNKSNQQSTYFPPENSISLYCKYTNKKPFTIRIGKDEKI